MRLLKRQTTNLGSQISVYAPGVDPQLNSVLARNVLLQSMNMYNMDSIIIMFVTQSVKRLVITILPITSSEYGF